MVSFLCIFPYTAFVIGTGEESIPMLMYGNHSEKEDSLSHNRAPSSGDKVPVPRLVGLAPSNQGTPVKVLEVKSAEGNSSTVSVLASSGW